MAGKPTPEERLFAVIQGAAHRTLRRNAPALTLAGLAGKALGIVGPLDLPRINQGLLVVAIGLGALCAVSPFIVRPRLEHVLGKAQQYLAPFVMAPPLEGLRPTDEYVSALRRADPFRLGEAPPAEPGAEPVIARPPPPAAQQALGNLRLVGIAKTGARPRAMIEDVTQNATSIVGVGDIVGPFTVKAILEDRVVFDAGGAEMELF